MGWWVTEAADAVYCACDHKYIIVQWRCILKKKSTAFFKIYEIELLIRLVESFLMWKLLLQFTDSKMKTTDKK